MEVGSALATVLFAAFSLPCLLLLVVAAEAALRLASLALRGDGSSSSSSYAWPSRTAFLGYRISRPSSSAANAGSGAFHFQDQLLLPPECLDHLAVAAYRGGGGDNGGAAEVDCVFCLSRIEEGDEVRELRCRHVFHRACLDAWLLIRPRATCPLCRDRLLPADTPRACSASDDSDGSPLDDDDEIYPEDDDDAFAISSSSNAAAASYHHHGAALWHT